MFICVNCKKGLMDPVRNEEEPEYTDRYQCGHCGQVASIPSLAIIFGQMFSSLLGGGISFFLLLQQLNKLLVLSEQPHNTDGLLIPLLLLALAFVLLGGFIYTLYRASQNFYRRYQYLHP